MRARTREKLGFRRVQGFGDLLCVLPFSRARASDTIRVIDLHEISVSLLDFRLRGDRRNAEELMSRNVESDPCEELGRRDPRLSEIRSLSPWLVFPQLGLGHLEVRSLLPWFQKKPGDCEKNSAENNLKQIKVLSLELWHASLIVRFLCVRSISGHSC